MRITADTNVLVRALVADDEAQAAVAAKLLRTADSIAITLPTLCELVWVLSRGYRFSISDVTDAIRSLIDSATVHVDHPAAEAGLAVLQAGSDFADGVIAYEGRKLGGEVFASFDRAAVGAIKATEGKALLLG